MGVSLRMRIAGQKYRSDRMPARSLRDTQVHLLVLVEHGRVGGASGSVPVGAIAQEDNIGPFRVQVVLHDDDATQHLVPSPQETQA